MDTCKQHKKAAHALVSRRVPYGLHSSRESGVLVPLAVILLSMALRSPAAAWAQDSLLLTQTPREPQNNVPKSLTDVRYPSGTRVILSKAPFASDHAVVLSQGLFAAGSPIVSYDGRRVIFAGKATVNSDWQIYQTGLKGGRPRALTEFAGGATHPALLGNGDLIFAAPNRSPAGATASVPSQLFAQTPGEQPRQLTFAQAGASDPTMLLDGRILFVSALPAEDKPDGSSQRTGTSLYTINNDGTELTAFACQHEIPALIYSPRQLKDGRIAFLSAAVPSSASIGENELNRKSDGFSAETVRLARPFASRASLLKSSGKNNPGFRVVSVQPEGASNLLICAAGPATGGRFCCYRVNGESRSLPAPLIAHSSWDTIEAVEVAPPTPPTGRISTMEAAKKTGQILCLDINNTTLTGTNQAPPKAVRVRLLARTNAGVPRVLGEVDVQADGSFMAEVPADLPLGFEALDEQGQVVRREAPSLWVRSGENRSCVGCHAPHNQAPHNHRPLAVRVPVPNFCESPVGKTASQANK